MKKLKKQFLAAVLTAVMAVCAFAGTTPVAAATLSAKQYINKMAKATEKLKSYEMKMNMDMDMSVQGKTTSTKTTSTTIAFASPLKTKTVMTMTIPSNGKDTKIKVISYTKQKGNKLLQYTSN
jgi:outer membrane lipoprotein-sorting protein